jgi:hypothetical protein
MFIAREAAEFDDGKKCAYDFLTSAAPTNPATAKPAPTVRGEMELGAGAGTGVTTATLAETWQIKKEVLSRQSVGTRVSRLFRATNTSQNTVGVFWMKK